MGSRLFFGAEGTHEAEILQSPSTKDEAKAAGGYINNNNLGAGELTDKYWIFDSDSQSTKTKLPVKSAVHS